MTPKDYSQMMSYLTRPGMADGGRIGFDAGGQAKLLNYVESLPKGSTVTRKLLNDYTTKSKIEANVENFLNRNIKKAKNLKDITVDRSAPKFYSTKPLKEGSNIKTSTTEIAKFLKNQNLVQLLILKNIWTKII